MVERDNTRTCVTLTTIAFATIVDLRSQNKRPGVSPYPVGIAVDSTRAVREGFFLLHDSRKSCVLSRKLCIVFGLHDSHASRGRSNLSYLIVENAKGFLPYLNFRPRAKSRVGAVCPRAALITANPINQARE